MQRARSMDYFSMVSRWVATVNEVNEGLLFEAGWQSGLLEIDVADEGGEYEACDEDEGDE